MSYIFLLPTNQSENSYLILTGIYQLFSGIYQLFSALDPLLSFVLLEHNNIK